MTTVGFVGWRGMVGSVLMQRMQAEGDFANIEPTFFTTSNVGGAGPAINGKSSGALKDANDNHHLERGVDNGRPAGAGARTPRSTMSGPGLARR